MGLTFDQMFNPELGYGKGLLWLEIGLCGIVPALMFLVPSWRRVPWVLYTAAILACIGVTINRFVFTVQALAIPVMPFDQTTGFYGDKHSFQLSSHKRHAEHRGLRQR